MIFHKQSNQTISHRQELAEQETQLINSLLGLAPPPIEVDSRQVLACGLSLKRKRARTLARFEGDNDTTCSALKPAMESYFKAYPGPHPSGPHADFKQYQQFLSCRVYDKLKRWIQKRLRQR